MVPIMAVTVTTAVSDWASSLPWRLSGLTLLLLLTALTYIPVCRCMVMCNEFDTCLPVEKQFNLTQALRNGDRIRVCHLATSAIECLDEAREDCDNGYKNLPEYIVQGLESKKTNMTVYKTTYCGGNGSDRTVSNMAAILLSTVAFYIICFI